MLLASVKLGNCGQKFTCSKGYTLLQIGSPTKFLAVVLLHAFQTVQQVIYFAFDLAQLPFNGQQLIDFHCR